MMTNHFRTLLILTAVLLTSGAFGEVGRAADKEKAPSLVGKQIEAFSLSDFRGQPWQLPAGKDQKFVVVVFLGTDCPLMMHYSPRLQDLSNRFADQGVAFVAINSNVQDSLAEIGHFAKHSEITFPMLKDPGNKIADAFGAERTPEVFVLDAERKVRYHGRIDDQYLPGIARPKVSRKDLEIALEELVAGKAVTQAETQPVGCLIGKVLRNESGTNEVTYTKHIAGLLNKHCVRCHREGEIGPFPLTNYEEVVGWAEMMEEVVGQQRMPPWHASPEHGKFRNDARLSNAEKELLSKWIDGGAPEGDPQDLPPAPQFTQGWQIGEPDLVVYMSETEFQVPASGEVKYKYFMVDPGFTEDKWVQAAECRPGNRQVVHHIIVAAKDGRALARGNNNDLEGAWLAATAPGAKPLVLDEGYAKKIPAGSKLIFQMHYTPNGKATSDRSCIGLKFADPKTVHKEVVTAQAATRALRIPPGADNHRVEATHTLKRDSIIYAFFPHMHLRGKAFRYTAIFPDGRREILLDIPHYDFSWQNSYELAEPLRLPAGSKLYCEAYFDNSKDNLANPDPTATVRWGDQTWEEMMIGYFAMSLADQDLQQVALRRTDDFLKNFGQDKEVPLTAQIDKLAPDSLKSNEALMKLGQELRKTAPQLDRVCWTRVENKQLEVVRCAQEPELEQVVGGVGRKLPVLVSKVAKYVEKEKVVVLKELSAESGVDVQHMARAYGSSIHIPVKIDGAPGTINFWSAEKDAFPPNVVTWLEKVASEMK